MKYPEDDYLFFETKTQEICSVNKDTYKFFYFRDTSFGIPKLYIEIINNGYGNATTLDSPMY